MILFTDSVNEETNGNYETDYVRLAVMPEKERIL